MKLPFPACGGTICARLGKRTGYMPAMPACDAAFKQLIKYDIALPAPYRPIDAAHTLGRFSVGYVYRRLTVKYVRLV